jgi:hypothetical protein
MSVSRIKNLNHIPKKVTVKDLKIARVGIEPQSQPCGQELKNYLNALAQAPEHEGAPRHLVESLANCMEQYVTTRPYSDFIFSLSSFLFLPGSKEKRQVKQHSFLVITVYRSGQVAPFILIVCFFFYRGN